MELNIHSHIVRKVTSDPLRLFIKSFAITLEICVDARKIAQKSFRLEFWAIFEHRDPHGKFLEFCELVSSVYVAAMTSKICVDARKTVQISISMKFSFIFEHRDLGEGF